LSVLFVLLLAFAGWRAWTWWQAQQRAAEADTARQLDALAGRIDALRRDQRAQAQRIRQADATNRLLRDELIAIGQRAGLLEDSVARLADPERHGSQALRLDEVELLLSQGAQRLQLSGDLDGARRAYALAGGLLDGVEDPAYLNLRQTLAQERAALEALGADPRVLAAGRLDAFAATLAFPPASAPAHPAQSRPWWRRAFARIVEVHPSQPGLALAPDQRAAGHAALQLELALARVALERRDASAWRAALGRADTWLVRLWPDSRPLRARREQLRELRGLPLALTLPTFGTTLRQLRQLRAAR
jgi:uroporphyrin-3 C-methyltransferase